MAVRHVIAGGTKASGNSTADDWTLANCYPTIASAIAASGIAAGDEIILEHLATYDVTAMIAKSLGINGSFTVRARFARVNNLNKPDCIIRGTSASGALFIFNDSVKRADIEFRDVGFTKSVTHTDATRPYAVQATQKTGNLTLTRCWVHDVDVAISGASNYRLGAFNYAASPTAAAAVSWNGLTFSNITGTFGTGNCTLLFEHSNSTNITYTYRGLTYRNLDVTCAGGFNFAATTSGNLTTITDFDAADITLSGTAVSGIGSLLSITARAVTPGVEEYGSCFIRNVKMKNISVTAPVVNAAIISYVPTDAKNILGISVVLYSTNFVSAPGLGCLISVFGNLLHKKSVIRKVRAYRCQSGFGTAVYFSNGAGGIADTIWAEECRCGNGVFYKGGNGDVSFSNLVAVNNEWIDVIGSNAALVFHGHNGGSSGDTRACTIGLRNLISKGNTHSLGAVPISFAYDPGSYSLSAVVRDIVCREESSEGNTIRIGTGLVDLDIADCNLAGAIDNAGTGSVTESGTTDSDVVIIGGLSLDTELDDRWPVAYRVAA